MGWGGGLGGRGRWVPPFLELPSSQGLVLLARELLAGEGIELSLAALRGGKREALPRPRTGGANRSSPSFLPSFSPDRRLEASGDCAAHPGASLCACAHEHVLPESPSAFLHASPREYHLLSPEPLPPALSCRTLTSHSFQVPVPMFLPTTLESTEKIVETIEELKVKIPSNPLEADILAMAEMIAEAEELDKASSDLCGGFRRGP